MNAFGFGILYGGLGAAAVLGIFHAGKTEMAVVAALIWVVIMTVIPNKWVGMR